MESNEELNQIRREMVGSYLAQLRSGDPHAVATAHMLRTTLAQLGLTLEDVGSNEAEVEGCIYAGRRISAAMLLVMAEREKLDDNTILHFFAFNLRYRTKNYKEVVQFLRDIAEQSATPLPMFEAVQHRFEEIVQGCYATVAKYHLQTAIQNRNVRSLTFLEEIITEGELQPERHLGVTRENIEQLKERVRNFHTDPVRETLTCLRGQCDHTHIPENMNGIRHAILTAHHDGGITLDDLGITMAEMEQIVAAHDHEAALRSKAAFN